MKKRSLFSAVAMLIVSAIVLTSATYAWFASNDAATVNAVSADVSTSDGSLLISADNGVTWKTGITTSDFTEETGFFIPQTAGYGYAPVSVNGSSQNIVLGAIGGTAFEANSYATPGEQYTKFTFKVKTSVDATVVCKPDFSTDVNYGFALVEVTPAGKTTTTYLYGKDTDQAYFPIADKGAEGVDANGNSIMDADELTSGALAAEQKAANVASISVETKAEEIINVTVILWAEGQHADCKGAVAGQSIGIGFSFEK